MFSFVSMHLLIYSLIFIYLWTNYVIIYYLFILYKLMCLFINLVDIFSYTVNFR